MRYFFRYVALLVAAMFVAVAWGQTLDPLGLKKVTAGPRTARDFFTDPQAAPFASLSTDARAAMAIFFGSDGPNGQANRMGDTSTITLMNDRALSVALSASKTVDLRLLTSGHDTVLAVIETVKTPAADSRITFYDTHWRPIDGRKVWKRPVTMADFIKPGTSKDTAQAVLRNIPFPLISLAFEGDDRLVATQQLAAFYTKTDRDFLRMKPYLNERVTFKVSGTKITRP